MDKIIQYSTVVNGKEIIKQCNNTSELEILNTEIELFTIIINELDLKEKNENMVRNTQS